MAVRLDLMSPVFYGDIDGMHAALRELRAQSPVCRDDVNGIWGVLTHAEVIDVERRDATFCNGQGYRFVGAPGEQDTIALDGEEHAEQRKLVARRFTPKAVNDLQPVIRQVYDDLIAVFLERGEVDLVNELAAPLPAKMTAYLLGFGDEHWPLIRTASERLMRTDEVGRDPVATGEFMQAIMEFSAVLAPLLTEARVEPKDDLIGVWAQSEVKGCPMDDGRIMQETGLFISGGAETTRTTIARGMLTFAEHNDQWDAMHDDPSLIPDAVEEMLRWVTPLNNFFRTATEDAQIAGVDVKEGDKVCLLYPSANRDETVFKDPYTFDIRRNPNPQIAFGFGAHFCLGAPLARQELRILLEKLVPRITNLRVTEAADIEPNVFVGAVRSARLGFDLR
ncbi:MAG TPA: cytochrome P450 [Acidimicrobiales bacterium]|nr:cytochrome P450 [Acidimicrobiales bacterium]